MEKVKRGDKSDFNLGSNGVLRFRNRIVVPKDEGLKNEILEEAHRSKFTVYPGGNKMYQNLKSLYWWENMKKEIVQFIQTCSPIKVNFEDEILLRGRGCEDS